MPLIFRSGVNRLKQLINNKSVTDGNKKLFDYLWKIAKK